MNFWIEVLPPVLALVLIWWGATGIIIYACGRKSWRPWAFAFVTALQPLAFWQLWQTRNQTDTGGVFASLFWAIVIWSWLETSYYSGVIVGRKDVPDTEPDAPTGLRFRRAIAANLYHELSLIGVSLLVAVVGWGGTNETGLWAFLILHWTHQSAKINIFLGVNNLTTEYLPENLRYMAQYFMRRPMNNFFPFSVTISVVIATLLLLSAINAPSAGVQTGQALLFVMMVAAVLEHWWLVTPLPSRAWAWAIKNRPTETPSPTTDHKHSNSSLPTVNIVCGYLGSGKTTLIRNLLPQLNERVAVVVNDFGQIGIDAELIRGDKAAGAVVELPGGCICCTLQKNLTGQLVKLLDEYQPERVIIEPSGVAGIEDIVRVLANPRLLGRVGTVEVIAVVEAPRLITNEPLPGFTVAQLKVARAAVISKSDLVSAAQLERSRAVVSQLNPESRVLTAQQGQLSAAALFETNQAHADEPGHSHADDNGFISFSRELGEAEFNATSLRLFFERVAAYEFGQVERAKGIFKVGDSSWQAWDLASGRVTCRLLPDTAEPHNSRFLAIATDLVSEALESRLLDCLAEPAKIS